MHVRACVFVCRFRVVADLKRKVEKEEKQRKAAIGIFFDWWDTMAPKQMDGLFWCATSAPKKKKKKALPKTCFYCQLEIN